MDSTRRSRPAPRLAVAALTLLALLVALPSVARADGDPASDVLVGQNVFLPPDAGASAGALARLGATVSAAGRAGYPLRVAVIASPADLGSIGQLWGKPEAYAEFLGRELSLAAPSRVLVVMPAGFGLSQPGASVATDAAQLARAPAPARGGGIATVATRAVGNLAGAAGHPIPAASVHVAAPSAGGPALGPVAAATLAVGALAILTAWALSLRARPLGRPPRTEAPS